MKAGSISEKLLKNDLVFDVVSKIIEHLPQKQLGELGPVSEYLSKSPDPVVLKYENFSIVLDRNSLHDCDVFSDYFRRKMYDPLLSKVIKQKLRQGDIFVDGERIMDFSRFWLHQLL